MCKIFCMLKNSFYSGCIWALSLKPKQVQFSEASERLLYGMTVTSKCRYNASIRIKRLGQFSFFTTTILSLALILIPLLAHSGIKLSFQPKVLNMMQIFIAVAVLVYSVVNSTSKYETRAERLNSCGDKIKQLIRELRAVAKNMEQFKLDDLNRRYSIISQESENHTRADYSLARIRTPEYYKITGVPWCFEWLGAMTCNLMPYIIPSTMILITVSFILDMLGVSNILIVAFQPADSP